jgi:hypothetical protein
MLNKLTRSSVDPTKLSMTFRGILVSLIPLIIMVTGLNPDAVNSIADMLVEMVFIGATFYSSALVLVGLIRKAYVGRWVHPDVE